VVIALSLLLALNGSGLVQSPCCFHCASMNLWSSCSGAVSLRCWGVGVPYRRRHWQLSGGVHVRGCGDWIQEQGMCTARHVDAYACAC
jgi:hypothetical protein